MTTVYLVQHLHVVEGAEDVKLVGIYGSEDEARQAIDRLRQQPGFRDFPDAVDPSESEVSGFQVCPYVIGIDYWPDGFTSD